MNPPASKPVSAPPNWRRSPIRAEASPQLKNPAAAGLDQASPVQPPGVASRRCPAGRWPPAGSSPARGPKPELGANETMGIGRGMAAVPEQPGVVIGIAPPVRNVGDATFGCVREAVFSRIGDGIVEEAIGVELNDLDRRQVGIEKGQRLRKVEIEGLGQGRVDGSPSRRASARYPPDWGSGSAARPLIPGKAPYRRCSGSRCRSVARLQRARSPRAPCRARRHPGRLVIEQIIRKQPDDEQ